MSDRAVWKESDVLIVGGGVSGMIAAVAAARTGAKTLLVESNAFFGGTATASMVPQFFALYHNEEPVVSGIPQELLGRLESAGGSTGFRRFLMAELTDTPILMVSFPFDPEIMKIVLDEFLMEANVELLLCARAVDVLVDRGKVTGVVVEGLSKRRVLSAKCTVDATGDAVVAYKAGVECLPEPSSTPAIRQPMSLIFRLTGVDVAMARSVPREEKMKLLREGLESGELIWKSVGFSTTPSGTDAIMMSSRVMGFDSLNEEDMTKAHITGRNQVKKIVKFLQRKFPGFEKAHLVSIAPYIGVRESRQILGEYVLTEDDVLTAPVFPDAICLGSGPLDVHDSAGISLLLKMPKAPFGIPYRCMVPKTIDGLIVTGRCISGTRNAIATVRHMGTAMALGHAAGTAAALSVKTHREPRSIDVELLRSTLIEQGAMISPPG